MKKLLFIIITIFALNASCTSHKKPEIINIGDTTPKFKLTTIDGQTIDSESLKGKVIYLNFFATWCAPCMSEITHVETDIWKNIKNEDFVMVCIGRGHSEKEMNAFKAKKRLTLPLGADPKRENYNKFALETIPRNIIIDKTGKIVYSKKGFNKEEFKLMIELIKTELKK